MHTVKKNIGDVFACSKEISLGESAEKTERMFMSSTHNAGEKHKIKINNKTFECVA